MKPAVFHWLGEEMIQNVEKKHLQLHSFSMLSPYVCPHVVPRAHGIFTMRHIAARPAQQIEASSSLPPLLAADSATACDDRVSPALAEYAKSLMMHGINTVCITHK